MVIFSFVSFLAIGIYALVVGLGQIFRAHIALKKFEIWLKGENKQLVRGYLLAFLKQNDLIFMNGIPSACSEMKKMGWVMVLIGLFALSATIPLFSLL